MKNMEISFPKERTIKILQGDIEIKADISYSEFNKLYKINNKRGNQPLVRLVLTSRDPDPDLDCIYRATFTNVEFE